MAELKKMNKLSSNYVKVGQKLVVGYTYVAPPKTDNTQAASDSTAVQASGGTTPSGSTANTSSSSSNNSNASSSSTIIYTVKAGDTLYKIATKYGVTVKQIAACNGLTNVNTLHVGQKLKIPKK